MIKLFEALTESIDIDSNICSDTEKLEHPEHNAIYKATVETINSNTQNVTNAAKEIIINYRDFSDFKNIPETPARVSSLALNPSIELIDKSELNDLVTKINNVEVNALTDRLENESIYNSNMKLSDYDVTECKLDTKLIFNKVIKAMQTITLLYENIEDCNSIIIGELSKCESTYMFDLLSRISSIVTFREAKKIEMVCKAIYPLIMMAHQSIHNLNEATETATINNEDIMTYVNELSELVPKCREYFDTFKYKELVTPRKKKINKMMEYMRGALDRKYTLRIPLYKVVNASPEAKNIIENQFIKGLEKIVNKYPNYILMTPDFKDDDDMFIYITLKEPFGKEEHRSDRKAQSDAKTLEEACNWEDPEYNRINNAIDRQNRLIDNISAKIDRSIVAKGKEDPSLKNAYDEACDARDKLIKERHVIAKRMMNETALTSDDRNNLPDEIFGLPGRRYPLNDMNHIRLAIARMDPCTRDEKRDLANNICRQICQQKLVGKINMSPSNPNCKYFPKWLCDQDASMDGGYIHSNGDKFSVKEILTEGLSGHTLEFYI